jgi:hypothetical protein
MDKMRGGPIYRECMGQTRWNRANLPAKEVTENEDEEHCNA